MTFLRDVYKRQIGVGLSAQYGWQAVFNTFGALAIAAETYGLQGAVSLRVIQNVFGVVFALAFCVISVSYTHLDVYKRQRFSCSSAIHRYSSRSAAHRRP